MKKRQILFSIIFALLALAIQAQTISKDTISDLKFRHIGPVGNRIISVAGHSG